MAKYKIELEFEADEEKLGLGDNMLILHERIVRFIASEPFVEELRVMNISKAGVTTEEVDEKVWDELEKSDLDKKAPKGEW